MLRSGFNRRVTESQGIYERSLRRLRVRNPQFFGAMPSMSLRSFQLVDPGPLRYTGNYQPFFGIVPFKDGWAVVEKLMHDTVYLAVVMG